MTDGSVATGKRDGGPTSSGEALGGMSAALCAATMTTQYVAAALIVSAGERGAIDPARVFAMLELLASGFERGVTAAGPTGATTAMMLRGVAQTYKTLVTIPPGAGRA